MNVLDQNISPSDAEQARLELTMAAAGAERANRPRGLLYLSLVLLAAAGIYALMGLSARSAAISKVAAARRSADEVIQMTNDLKTLQATLEARGVEYNPNVPNLLEQLAQEHRAEPASVVTEQTSGLSGPNMIQKKYPMKFVNQSPDALLGFLDATQESPQTAGVEISRIEVKPGGPDATTGQVLWNMDVDFTRWERKR
jgi:hypothetical protein